MLENRTRKATLRAVHRVLNIWINKPDLRASIAELKENTPKCPDEEEHRLSNLKQMVALFLNIFSIRNIQISLFQYQVAAIRKKCY